MNTQSPWLANKRLMHQVNLKTTGGINKFWLKWIFEDKLKRTFDKVLSVGCGTGGHEMIMSSTGLVKSIDAFDISDNAIKNAKNDAKENGITNINFMSVVLRR